MMEQTSSCPCGDAAWFRALVGGCFPPSLRGISLAQLGRGRFSALLLGGGRRLGPFGFADGFLTPPTCLAVFLAPPTCLAVFLAPPTCLSVFLAPPTCLAVFLAHPTCLAMFLAPPTCLAVLFAPPWFLPDPRPFRTFEHGFGLASREPGYCHGWRKGRELADVMERRKVDILCVQETRWKGSKARSIGAGFKLFYYGVDSKRNGVGVVLKEEFVRNLLEVGCELEEKERFWSELDEVMENIPTGDEEVMGKFGVKERNLEGQMVVDFAKRMDMGVVNTYFQKREEHRVTYKSGGRRTQIEKKTKWWKLKKEECSEVIRETGRKVLGVSSGRRKEDKETWWWNEEVQDSIQRKRLAKKKWDMDRTEENRQEYKELQRRVKREVSKAKQKAYEELYTRLDTREGEKDLYRVLTSEESVQRRWKEYFEELMNEENEREKRVEGVNSVEQKVDKIRKDEVRKALKRMKSGKAVGPDDIPVEVWKCLGEAAVEFLASLFNRVLENLEKAYDRVPREELWYCMRKSGVAEKYVRVVQDMYERSRTVVRCAVGQTEEFNVEVGLHQGSALSPFLFAMVMDQLSEEVRQESPWTMMFADDIVICSESREQVEENLERWRFALERRGMKVSRSKTEYMCVNEREGSGTVRLQGEEVKKVQEFKYLGSTVQSNGECGKEVKKRVQAGWNGWRKVSGVLCDQKISARIKGKVYRTVVRPAMLYGLETVSLRKRQESELEVAELKMLRFSLGVTRLDRIRNEYIRGTAHVGRLGDKVREARLRWFGHVQRRDIAGQFPDRPREGAGRNAVMPRVEEMLVSYLYPTSPAWRNPVLPSKPCRVTSALVRKAYTAAGQADPSLHPMVVLQLYQAELLSELDCGEGFNPETVSELCGATDLVLRDTKQMARTIA
ncbi:hypothetical protein QTP70_009712 [Hemibagrus guttatus]|uniref:ribonuclease H n=1 Tax=Hemibagrus guttatus TaxID=175788 RepID=A0AAE0UPW8_9TELE|nr:hypothetical protein QTP70_009712 [Hemibagrus guttatus]